jgi:Fur family ferric uptake transcriptional regulator
MAPQREEFKILAAFLRKKGLKHTSQRETVLRLFLEAPKHLSVDELAARVRQADPGIGYSTVYRTLKLFTECGLALESKFLHEKACFEHGYKIAPHNHLVCTRCGTVSEFTDPLIPAVTEKICRGLDFKNLEHRVEIYGLCSSCQGPKESRKED